MYNYENAAFSAIDLTFRKLEREDLPRLLELKQETWSNTHSTTIVNMEDQERWFDSLDKDVHCPRNLILVAFLSPQPPKNVIDRVGIFKIFNVNYVNGSADVAWDIFREMRGKKYGKILVSGGVQFCMDILGLRRLNAEILRYNEASLKCALAAGFVEEGVRRKAVFKSGRYIDSIIFGYVS